MSKNLSNYSFLGALLVSLVLMGCSSDGDPKKLLVLNDLAMSGSSTVDFINVDKTQGSSVENVKKLVIPSFNVTYKLKVKGTAVDKVWQGDKETSVSTHMKVNMENPNVAMMQRVTNKAYNNFVAELKKAKFEVVPVSDVAKSDAYYQVNHKSLVTSATPADESVTLVADGLKSFDPDEKMDPDGSFMMGVANINSASYGDLVEELGGVEKGVAALVVNLVVQYGNFDLEDHRVSETIDFNPSFTVVAEGTSMELITGFKAVSIPGRVFYMTRDNSVFSLKQDMGSKTNVIAGMKKVSSAENSEEYNATLNEGGFERDGVKQVDRVGTLLVKAMTTR